MNDPDLSLNAGQRARPRIPEQRPLAQILMPGHVLTDRDVAELRDALGRLDNWAAEFRKREESFNTHAGSLKARYEALLANYPVPIVGFGVQDGVQTGMYDDLWSGPSLALTIQPRQPVRRIVLHGWVPDDMPAGATMTFRAAGGTVTGDITPGVFSWSIEPEGLVIDSFPVEVAFSHWTTPEGPDGRQLAFVVREIELEH